MIDNEPPNSPNHTHPESDEITQKPEYSKIFDIAREALTHVESLASTDTRFDWFTTDIENVPGSSVLNLLRQAIELTNNMSYDQAQSYALNQKTLTEPITLRPAVGSGGELIIYLYQPTKDDAHYAYESEFRLRRIEGSDGVCITLQDGRMLPGSKPSAKFAQNEADEFTMVTRRSTHAPVVPSSDDKIIIEYIPHTKLDIKQNFNFPLSTQ
jgi:hypothetical protein